jgi:hypothetical protein
VRARVINRETPRGLIFIQLCDRSVAPVELVTRMFRELVDTGIAKTRHCIRLWPVVATSFNSLPDFTAMVKRLVPVYFADVASVAAAAAASSSSSKSSSPPPPGIDSSFGIDIRRRGGSSVTTRELLIPVIAALVPDSFPVDLKKPRHCILVQTIERWAFCSVIPDYHAPLLLQCNVRDHVDAMLVAAAGAGAAAAAATPATGDATAAKAH